MQRKDDPLPPPFSLSPRPKPFRYVKPGVYPTLGQRLVQAAGGGAHGGGGATLLQLKGNHSLNEAEEGEVARFVAAVREALLELDADRS